jgi:hypothetical protein
MSLLTPEESTFIAKHRAMYARGETPSLEEMRRAVLILRQRRTSALEANAASGTKRAASKKAAPTQAAIASALDELDNF